MISAPPGDEEWLLRIGQRLQDQLLKPIAGTQIPEGTRLNFISENQRDGVRDKYTQMSRFLASFTPVILPGHTDGKQEKTRKLILKALQQAGIDQPCEFEW